MWWGSKPRRCNVSTPMPTLTAFVGGTVDGAACDRLANAGGGVMSTLAGAMRAGQQIVPLATPGKDISSYEVTPGIIRMIAGSTKSDVSGVWVSTDVAKDFGLTKGSVMQTEQGTMSVAGVFDWPNDSRDTRFAYAFLVPVSASNGTFDECWVRQWPQSGQTGDLLYSTLVASGSSSNAGVTQVNKSFDSHYDAQASYEQRMTRWMPWLGLAVGCVRRSSAYVVVDWNTLAHCIRTVQRCSIAGNHCGNDDLERFGVCLFSRAVGCVLRSHEQRRCDDRMVGCDAHAMCDIRWSDGSKHARRYDDT